jgi:hypothetical protein
MDAPVLEMTQAEYARHRGVSPQAVNKQVKAGKIPLLPNGKIDAAAADRALGETRERVTLRDEPDEADAPRAAPAEGAGLTKAKTATEVYRARLAQLEYEERVGRVVPTANVGDAATACAEVTVKALEMALMRVDAMMAAAAKGEGELRQVVRELIRDQRQRIVDEWAKLAAAVATKDQAEDA